jgi:xyloglucan-specific endo-beta-1,4-glucanase
MDFLLSHSNLYCGVNKVRNIKTFSWLSTDNVTTSDFDINLLLEPLWKNNLVPSDVQLGLVEFGTETFYAADNVTFSVSDFAVNITTNSSTVTTNSSTGTTNGTTKPHSSDSPRSRQLFVWCSYAVWSSIAVIVGFWM